MTYGSFDLPWNERHRRPGDPVWVDAHFGNAAAFIERHTQAVEDAAGRSALYEVAPLLYRRMTDFRALRVAARDLARKGSTAPGPNGVTIADWRAAGIWHLIRSLSKAIREGFRHTAVREVRIAKPGGGYRTLTIANLEDRLVARAMVLILRPYFEQIFDPHSFGFRPNRGRLEALATAVALSKRDGMSHWVVDDVAAAFDRVPRQRLLQICSQYVHDDVVDLIGRCLPGNSRLGIPQGSPLSPLLLNIVLHHVVDRHWRQRYPKTPLLRTADDLPIVCRDRKEAEERHRDLQRRLEGFGMPLKGGPTRGVRNLTAGECVSWLGFRTSLTKVGAFRFQVADYALQRLTIRLEKLHLEDLAPIRATKVLSGWIDQQAPTYPAERRDDICRQALQIARGHGFEELPSIATLKSRWSAAHARWCRLRDRITSECQLHDPGRNDTR